MGRESSVLREYSILLKDRAVEPCPPGMREEVRRALLCKLAELEAEVQNCRRRALEGGCVDAATELQRLAPAVMRIADGLREERTT